MSATVLYMSMSLDGFVTGPNEGPGNGLGDGGLRLHGWLLVGERKTSSGIPGRPSGVNGQLYDEFMATGAVVAGRRTFELAGGWGGDHHDGVPIFVFTRREPGSEAGYWPLVTYVTDVQTAMTDAKKTAGGLFDERGPEHIELERTRSLEGEAGVTHLHYRVKKGS